MNQSKGWRRANEIGTKFGGRKARADKNSFPPHPLPFCPPERKSFSKFSVRIFAEKSSDFVQGVEPVFKRFRAGQKTVDSTTDWFFG